MHERGVFTHDALVRCALCPWLCQKSQRGLKTRAICNARSRMYGLRDLQRIHRFTWFPERKDAARFECFKLFHFLVVQSEAAQVKIGSHPIRPCGLGQGRPKARGGEDNGGTECIGESETKDVARAETGGEDSYAGQICRRVRTIRSGRQSAARSAPPSCDACSPAH